MGEGGDAAEWAREVRSPSLYRVDLLTPTLSSTQTWRRGGKDSSPPSTEICVSSAGPLAPPSYGRGRSWARVIAAVLFGFNTLGLLSTVIRPAAIGTKIFDVLVWLVGLGAIVYLWRPDASEYYARSKFL